MKIIAFTHGILVVFIGIFGLAKCQSEQNSSAKLMGLPSFHVAINPGCSPHSPSISISHENRVITVSFDGIARLESVSFDLRAGTILKKEVENPWAPGEKEEITSITNANPAAFQKEIDTATDRALILAKGNVCTKPNRLALEVISEIEALNLNPMNISSECSPHSARIEIANGQKTLTIRRFEPESSKTWIIADAIPGEVYFTKANFLSETTRQVITREQQAEYVAAINEAIANATIILKGNVCKAGDPGAAQVVDRLQKLIH